jgi:hypothetical protein
MKRKRAIITVELVDESIEEADEKNRTGTA